MSGRLLVWGAGGHALSLADAMARNGRQIAAFAVEAGFGGGAKVSPVLVGPEALDAWLADVGTARYLVAIGLLGVVRERIAVRAESLGLVADRFTDGTAVVSSGAQIGSGTQVFALAHLGPEVRLGAHCIVNTGATVEHETVVGDYCDIAPKAAVLGRVRLGDRVLVGAGAVILPGLTICAEVTVGAGAVVTRSIDLPGTYVGAPARPI